jgi:nucleoside-diphosphate kinase
MTDDCVTDQTLALIKPDGVARAQVGEILRRVETKGYRVTALELRRPDRELLERHYAEHAAKPWFPELAGYMSSGPVVAAVLQGHRVVEGWRSLMGDKDCTLAAPGTLRGDLGRDWGHGTMENLVHGSDSPAAAQREIRIWFGPGVAVG